MTESDETREGRAEADAASRPWNVLVMATLAPLGGFPAVRLTPRLTQADLGIAANFAFPRSPGEFLTGVIQGASPGGASPILLTNHKILWFERLPSAPGQPSFAGRGAAYNDIGPDVAVATGSDGPAVDLGAGRLLALPPREPRLAEALAAALEILSHAARTGEAPAIDADLGRRIVQMIPNAVKVDASLRIHGEDRTQFREDLFRAVPNAYVTRLFVAACVLVYAAMVVKGVDPLSPSSEELLAWGANNDLLVALGGEWWRLPASVFLHVGGLHLAFNMWTLAGIGPLVERLYGNLRYATIYLAAGVGGAAASMATPPVNVSAGASGAIFGILGALLAFLIVKRHAVPSTILKPLRAQATTFMVFNIVLGATIPVIDQSAHLGGLATGFLAGLALMPNWPRRRATVADNVRSVVLSAVLALIVVATTAGLIHWRAVTFPRMERRAAAASRVDRPLSRSM